MRLAALFGVAVMVPLAACSPHEAAPRTPEIQPPSSAAPDPAAPQTTARQADAAPPIAATPPSHPDDERRAALGLASRHAAADPDGNAAPATEQRLHHAWFGSEPASTDVHRLADWVVESADNRGLPFILVDKIHAKVFVFGPEGHLRDAGPALLGLARGDDSVPDIGTRRIADIHPHERTTPAGRFVAELGVNSEGEDILWVDYEDAISMHRVRATKPVERRLQRLASPTASDNRISYGCINLPAAFYDLSVKPTFAARGGIVYVLPETRPLDATFPALKPAQLARR